MIKKGRQKSIYEIWRKKAEKEKISVQGLLRLEWIIFYYTHGKENAIKTSRGY